MEKAVPVKQIYDYADAKDFYVDKLGFEILFEARHQPGVPALRLVRNWMAEYFL